MIQSIAGFPGGSDDKDSGSVNGLGRSPGEGDSSPLQYPYPKNSMDRGAWKATGHRVAKSDTTGSHTHTHTHTHTSLYLVIGSIIGLCILR